MPRITISIIAPNHDLDQQILSFELPLSLSIADLKGFVTAETNVPPAAQQFYINNSPIQGEGKTIGEAGIKDGDMVAMLIRQPQQQESNSSNTTNDMGQARRGGQQSSAQQRGQQRGQSPNEIETARLSILGNPGAMAQVREQRPQLAEAINDPARFREVWMEMLREDEEREQERLEQMRLLNEDPFNVDAQRKIEEMIRQQSVQENLQFAYEHNPEVFGRVTMLYIPVHVNNHPVKAFVDSGAQTTIMSPSCAEACNIMRLIDKRYSGVAKGVGTAQILGRVHSSSITIGHATMPCSFTVMEGKDVDLLLGLDMLKRFQAVIDLKNNKLVFGDGNEVAFLGEADLPKYLEDALQAEPTVSGPPGTEIGTQSGTVKPAGTSAKAAANAAASSTSASANGAFGGQGRTLGAGSGKAAVNGRPSASASAGPSGSATPSAAVGATAQQRASEGHPKEAIEQLVHIGFSRDQAVAALDACDGNVDLAAGMLFDN